MVIAAATGLAIVQTEVLASIIRPSENSRRIWRAVENSDRTELPFLEETALSEDVGSAERVHTDEARIRLDREDAALAYIKLATLDEVTGFMRKLYDIVQPPKWRYYVLMRFLEKAAEGEKDAEDATRENLYAFLLEIVQGCDDVDNANKADVFLLERVPGYADSRQRAALTRYANTGNEWVTNTFNPIKAHFDDIPPSKRVDLRDRFPTLPPPPEESEGKTAPYLWLALGIIALAAAAIALTLRKPKKGKEK